MMKKRIFPIILSTVFLSLFFMANTHASAAPINEENVANTTTSLSQTIDLDVAAQPAQPALPANTAVATANVQSVRVQTTKTAYYVDENIDENTITVEVVFDDESTKIANKNAYIVDKTLYNSKVPGRYPIKVTLKGTQISDTFYVTTQRKKDDLKILAIGNSFSQDGVKWLGDLAKDCGAQNVVIGNMVIGGCPLVRHATNIKRNSKSYQYELYNNGSSSSRWGYSIADVLGYYDWDIVCIQQVSGLSGVASSYNYDIGTIINCIQQIRPNAVIAWQMTWAYRSTSSHEDFPRYNRDQMTMYNAIVNCAQTKILTNNQILQVIPSGTTIQNLRTSYLGIPDTVSSQKDILTRDGFHLSYGVGRYAAGLTWLKRLTGWSIDDIDFLPTTDTSANYYVAPTQLPVIKECVNNACANPFTVTNSTYTQQP